MIKSGGYRIGPAEVEAAIMLNPAMAECAVIGIPDPVRGQAVTAYAELVDGEHGTEALTEAAATPGQEEGRGSRVSAHGDVCQFAAANHHRKSRP